MGLTKPFAYMAGGTAGGWDPTLGGTLSVQHHWDFTDTSTMTFGGTGVSGSEVASITDKVGSIEFTPVDGPSGNATLITATGSYDTTNNSTYFLNSPYQYKNGGSYNWLPTNLKMNQNFTVVLIAGNYWDAYNSSTPRAMWYARANDTYGWDNLLCFMGKPVNWIAGNCSGTGDYEWGTGRYVGSWDSPEQKEYSTAPDTPATPSVYSVSHAANAAAFKFTRNNETECDQGHSTNLFDSAGEGLVVGGAPIGLNQNNNFQGNVYHLVVYSQDTSQTQKNNIYNSWNTFFNG